MRIHSLFILPLAASFLAAGCVSTSKYKKLETDSKAQQTKLADLDQQLAKVQQENAVLSQEKAELEKKTAESKTQYDSIINQLSQEAMEGQLQVTQYQNMLKVDVAEQIFFTSGSAKLKKSGQAVLKKVGAALAEYTDKIIRVVGHTDNIPTGANSSYPSNWELSVARATNVVRFLQTESQIAPERLVASGRAEFSPIAPNDTPEGRQKNRRIEIMLIDKSVADAMMAPK